jgi:hypothetical protein
VFDPEGFGEPGLKRHEESSKQLFG